jgi:hypothetical protein
VDTAVGAAAIGGSIAACCCRVLLTDVHPLCCLPAACPHQHQPIHHPHIHHPHFLRALLLPLPQG